MAVFPERIVLKNSTDSEASIISAIESGGTDEITQGELVLGIQSSSVKLYTLDSSGNVIAFGGSGLTDLSDVTLSSPVDGSLLSYNSSGNYWEDTKYIYINGLEFSDGDNQVSARQMEWRSTDGTLRLGYDNNVYNRIGQDRFVYCRNDTGSTIPRGTAVMFAGASVGALLISPAVADGSEQSSSFLGLAAESIDDGQYGQIKMAGVLSDLNTDGYSEGASLWCDPANPGGITDIEPIAPNPAILVGYVARESGSLGEIFIRGGAGSGEVEEAPADGNHYVRRNGEWVNVVSMFDDLNVEYTEPVDGGNFTSGTTSAISSIVYDGGNFTSGATAVSVSKILEGGFIADYVVDSGNFSSNTSNAFTIDIYDGGNFTTNESNSVTNDPLDGKVITA